ncbi:MAG: gamma carbonic anhydrase family protein [Myxococcales bacterium]|nr:gamma carbonic anhydrase family protein [Myxococcales bacterium]
MSEPLVRRFGDLAPRIDPSVWVAPGAVVVGDVEIGADSSVWYAAVVRGDVERVRIGARSNVQDGAVVHVTRDRFAAHIGDEVTVGHRAVVHGCTVEDGALIGIGAVVLDGARVGEGALVAAGALVTPGSVIEPHTVALGAPARSVRALGDDERREQRERTLSYVETARVHAASGACVRAHRPPGRASA